MTKTLGNQILSSLPDDVASRLNSYTKRVEFKLGHCVCEIGDTMRHAYFPETCVLPLMGVAADGTAIETAVIGSEGLYALHAIYHPFSIAGCLVQAAGGTLQFL